MPPVGLARAFGVVAGPGLSAGATVKSSRRLQATRSPTRSNGGHTMFKHIIFYTVAGSVFWTVAQKLGAGLGWSMAASLLLPPFIMMGWIIYKHRRPLL